MIERRIHWEKWVDPFGQNTKDMEWPGAFGSFQQEEVLKKKQREYYGYDEETEEMVKPIGPVGILSTPFGVIPITEHTNPAKIFNFWTMHTNFKLTRSIEKIIDDTPGIESVDIFTQYRCRIAIGKAFRTDEVKNALQENLNAQPPEEYPNAQEIS